MSVAQELKLKRGELAERLEELSRLQAEIRDQISSVDKVIAIYEPGYRTTPAKVRGGSQTPRISDETKRRWVA